MHTILNNIFALSLWHPADLDPAFAIVSQVPLSPSLLAVRCAGESPSTLRDVAEGQGAVRVLYDHTRHTAQSSGGEQRRRAAERNDAHSRAVTALRCDGPSMMMQQGRRMKQSSVRTHHTDTHARRVGNSGASERLCACPSLTLPLSARAVLSLLLQASRLATSSL